MNHHQLGNATALETPLVNITTSRERHRQVYVSPAFLQNPSFDGSKVLLSTFFSLSQDLEQSPKKKILQARLPAF